MLSATKDELGEVDVTDPGLGLTAHAAIQVQLESETLSFAGTNMKGEVLAAKTGPLLRGNSTGNLVTRKLCVFPFFQRFFNIKTTSTIFLRITHSDVCPLG